MSSLIQMLLAADGRVLVAAALTLAVVLVNGWTDAPNAIATAVTTGALPFRRAVRLAAVCNLLGVVGITLWNSAVAETIYSIADFGGQTDAALAALCAALTAIVVWSGAAWRFGIPTSESHALIAGIAGAALALRGGAANLHGGPWARVLLGLLASTLPAFLLGRAAARRLHVPRRLCPPLQIAGAAAMALLHGAQDGQKFMGIFLLGAALAQGRRDAETFLVPLWLMVLCALTMALGTAMGGRRIIDTVGRDMVDLDPRRGLCADLAGAGCLLLCTLLGLPVSTTHAKTSAIMGVGASSGRVDWRIAREILLTWAGTFPCCAVLGYFFSKLFLFFLF